MTKNTTKQKQSVAKKQVVNKKVSKTPPKKAKAVTPPPAKVEPKKEVVPASPPVEEVVDTSAMTEFAALSKDLDATLQMVRVMKNRLRDLEKRVARDTREMEKKMKNRKKRTVDPNAEPSGFAKPGPVSDELCKFLKVKPGTLVARTEVTKGINKYCKENNLQKESDKRTILPNKELKELLRLKKGDEVTFFNLQKYMKVHFPNKEGVFPTA